MEWVRSQRDVWLLTGSLLWADRRSGKYAEVTSMRSPKWGHHCEVTVTQRHQVSGQALFRMRHINLIRDEDIHLLIIFWSRGKKLIVPTSVLKCWSFPEELCDRQGAKSEDYWCQVCWGGSGVQTVSVRSHDWELRGVIWRVWSLTWFISVLNQWQGWATMSNIAGALKSDQ